MADVMNDLVAIGAPAAPLDVNLPAAQSGADAVRAVLYNSCGEYAVCRRLVRWMGTGMV